MPQQTQNRETAIRNKPLTPIEQLLADKNDVEARCNLQAQKVLNDFTYIRSNASSLVLSGLSSLLFSHGQTNKKPETQAVAFINENRPAQDSLFSVSNIFVVAKSMAPILWDIAKPLLIKWGVNKAKSVLAGLFVKKKSVPSVKQ